MKNDDFQEIGVLCFCSFMRNFTKKRCKNRAKKESAENTPKMPKKVPKIAPGTYFFGPGARAATPQIPKMAKKTKFWRSQKNGEKKDQEFIKKKTPSSYYLQADVNQSGAPPPSNSLPRA